MAAITNVTCPFCSLLCDDLSAQFKRGQPVISANACHLGRQGFSRPKPVSGARIHGVPVATERAIKVAAGILQKSVKPLIAGLGTDTGGIRSALQLAEKLDATLIHSEARHALHNLKALQARGGIMTTLAEVKNRADTIIFIGNNVTDAYPRFIERFVNSPYALFAGESRKIGYLGRPGRSELKGCDEHRPVVVSGRADEIADNLAWLRTGQSRRQLLDANRIPTARRARLKRLEALIKAAQYGVLVWSPAALPQDHADLIISALLDWLRSLNLKQRFAGLSLGGNNGGASFQTVATWQTGFPAELSFRDGAPSGLRTDLTNVDSLLWISGFSNEPAPKLDVPTILLSPFDSDTRRAAVHIPIGVPGIDHRGNLFRTDGVINLPLKKLRDSDVPSAAGVLNRIFSHLTGNAP